MAKLLGGLALLILAGCSAGEFVREQEIVWAQEYCAARGGLYATRVSGGVTFVQDAYCRNGDMVSRPVRQRSSNG